MEDGAQLIEGLPSTHKALPGFNLYHFIKPDVMVSACLPVIPGLRQMPEDSEVKVIID